MDFDFIFSPLAFLDIAEANNYYEQIQKGLGNKFLLNLEQSLRQIKRNPFFASVRYDMMTSGVHNLKLSRT
jgi:hypothetical protein